MAASRPRPRRLKIRRGDTVEVLTGKDVGRRGKVLEVIPTEGRLIVEKHQHRASATRKPRPVKGTRGAQMTPGGVIEKEAAAARRQRRARLPAAATSRRASATASRTNGDKIRHCRRAGCGEDIEK